jgi:hypothetical protein
MSSSVRRAAMGPSWSEVLLGALLSAVLGAVLGAVLLVLRPVSTEKEEPKEPKPGVVYYIEGTRDANRGSAAAQKRTGFAGGQSVTVNEDELNALLAGGPGAERPRAEAAKGPEAGKAAPAAEAGWVSVGKPNVRIRQGVLQVAAPVTVNALGLGLRLTAQARGGFVKRGEQFVFVPGELYLGSCPMQRIPVLGALVAGGLVSGISIPDDLRAAWAKARQVTVEGATLRVTMP